MARLLAPLALLLALPALSRAQAPGPSELKRLLGMWKVRRVLTMGPVSPLTFAQAKAFVGRVVQYETLAFRSGGDSVTLDGYRRREITADDFLTENKVPLERIGVIDPQVVQITVEAGVRGVAAEFGATVYLVSRKTIAVPFAGAWFELDRITAGAQ